jgi:2,3-bisphosphoglycerate-independent phosphoglycerate mutase
MSYEKKHIMIIMDGAGDVYRDDKGRSPLGIAYTRTPPVNCLLSEMGRQNSFARKLSWQKMNQSGSRCLQA